MKKSGNDVVWKLCLHGLGIAFGVTLLLMAAASALVLAGVLKPGGIGAAASVCAAAGSFAGALYAAKRRDTQKLVTGMVLGGVFDLLLLFGNLLFVDTPPVGFAAICLPTLGAALIACVLSSRTVRKPVKTRRK